MAYLIILAVSLAVLVVLFLRRKSANRITFSTGGRVLLWIALFLLGVQAIFWFGMGIGEISSGTAGAAMHLLPGAGIVLLMFLVWKIPLEGGLVLAFQGLALAVDALVGTSGSTSTRTSALIFVAFPPILVGLVLLWACGLSLKRRN